MPLYEYECSACGRRFERMQKFSDPVESCPACGGSVEKLVSSPAFQFKGSGWYVTDYARKGEDTKDVKDGKQEEKKEDKKEGKKDEKKDGKTEGKQEGKSDKTDAKTDTKAASSASKASESKAKGDA